MCHYFEAKVKHDGCEATPKHVVPTRKWDRCEEAQKTGYTCTDATPAKGLNGQVIQVASMRTHGACPRCLS
jgi:hypothetical protein